ncbi:MAG: hypothetical protein ACHQRJ_03690 [Alphaproteobacteria bacterium]
MRSKVRHSLFALALLVATPAAAQTDNTALAAAVQAEVTAACGNCLLAVQTWNPADRNTWKLIFTGGATAWQQQNVLAALRTCDLAKYQAQQSGGSSAAGAATGSAASP